MRSFDHTARYARYKATKNPVSQFDFGFRALTGLFCVSGFLQVERHEDTVRIEHIVGERWALHEAMAPVKRARHLARDAHWMPS